MRHKTAHPQHTWAKPCPKSSERLLTVTNRCRDRDAKSPAIAFISFSPPLPPAVLPTLHFSDFPVSLLAGRLAHAQLTTMKGAPP